MYVEPLLPPIAARLIGDLGRSMEVQLTDEPVKRVLDLIGPPVPYFILADWCRSPAPARRPAAARGGSGKFLAREDAVVVRVGLEEPVGGSGRDLVARE